MSETDLRIPICFPFVGDTIGGSHVSALLLIRHLRSPFRPLVVAHQRGPLVELLEHRDVPYRLLEAPDAEQSDTRSGYLKAALTVVPRLVMFLRRYGIALVHTNDIRMHRLWTLAARPGSARHIWHQRTPYLAPRLGRWLVLPAHRVISISDFVTETIPEHARGKTTTIRNPFDTEPDRPVGDLAEGGFRENLDVPDGTRIITFVGNLWNRKRPLIFAEMASILARRHPGELAFVMCGGDRDGNAARIREFTAARLPRDTFHQLGFVRPSETLELVAASDVIVAPAVNEAFGRVLVEAMLVGTPVVAARSGGHPAIVDDGRTGILVTPDDPDEFARAVEELLFDQKRAHDLAARAYSHAREEYSIHRHVEQVESVYREVLAG